MTQSYPSETTKKHVLAASGNQCSHPDCLELIFDLDHETMLGKIAHIKGRRPKSARYDATQTDVERNSFANLTALCAKHHDLVDDNEDRYPAQTLYKWKIEHEQKIANSLDRNWVSGFPSSISRMEAGGVSITIHYWVDQLGRPQVYTKEQLAKCRAIRDLIMLNNDVHTLLKKIDLLSDGTQIDWIKQEASKLKLNKYGFVGTLHEKFQIAHDVTFFDYTITNTQGGRKRREELKEDALKLLDEKVREVPDNPNIQNEHNK
jgi:hypothetical protein